MLAQIGESVAHAASDASAHAAMQHSMGPWSVAAAIFPYVAVAFIYIKRAILVRRYRRMAEELARTGNSGYSGWRTA